MPTFEVELPGGKRYEVEAPDVATASKQAQAFQVQQHPWNQFNKAARSGQVAEGGKEYPGAGYVPTAGQAAGEGGLLLGSILAGPAAAGLTGSQIVAPALARGGVAALPHILQGDPTKAGMAAGSSLGIDALMNMIGLGKFGVNRLMNRQPVVHQAANPPVAGGPIVFNRVGSGGTPTVQGGGTMGVTPTQVTVQPPASGQWASSGAHPAAILQEPVGGSAGHAMAEMGQGTRAAGTYAASKEPEITSSLLLNILEKAKETGRSMNPFGGGHNVGGMVP